MRDLIRRLIGESWDRGGALNALLRAIHRPARPLSARKCAAMTGHPCEYPWEHLLP